MNFRTPFAVLSVLLISSASLLAATGTATMPDKTLSPYFFIPSGDPEVDQLPLSETRAEVNISGVIAEVKVTQVYKNTGTRPIEAIYIFPASTRAAVSGMRMHIGERIIIARIAEREQARRDYEQAKDQGRSASLLEQQRPNVFQMNVANILPGDTIRVELRYTELLTARDGVYEFIYPTVVGPRYSEQPEAGAPADEKWIANPYTHSGEKPAYRFGMRIHLSAGLPVRDIRSPSHNISIDFDSARDADIRLAAAEEQGGNRDFILNYRLTGDRIESGLLLWQGQEENFFLLMMQPPKQVSPKLMPPREYIFIVDVSGSMNGFPLNTSKTLLRDLIGGLRPQDSFNVLLFAAATDQLAERSLPATQENIRKALDLIDRQRGGGGTRLLPALQRALSLPRSDAASRTVVIATDGYVAVEKQAFELIRTSLGKANFFTFGIGSSVNRFLIEGMARAGKGEAFVITSDQEAAREAHRFRKYITSPALTQIKIAYQNFDVYDVEPPAVPDIFSERPVLVFGKWRGPARGKIILTGTNSAGPYRSELDVAEYVPSPAHAALRILWARTRLMRLSDYATLRADDTLREDIQQLGLRYGLLTQYTSFVAIDSLVRNKDGNVLTVKQPLPLPGGVSDLAVAYSSSSVRKQAYWSAGFSRHQALRSFAPADEARSGIPATEQIKSPPHILSVLRVSPATAAQQEFAALLVELSEDVLDCMRKSGQTIRSGKRFELVLKITAQGELSLLRLDGRAAPKCIAALFNGRKPANSRPGVVALLIEIKDNR